jgi:hypothetical protein
MKWLAGVLVVFTLACGLRTATLHLHTVFPIGVFHVVHPTAGWQSS